MENFNTKKYRDNLAEDLRNVRKNDPEKAQQILNEEQQTIRYKEADLAHDKENRKPLQDEYKVKQELEKNLEIFNEWEKEFDSFLQQINSLPEDQKEEFITIKKNTLTHQLQVVKLIPWELYLELSRTSKELRRTAEDLPQGYREKALDLISKYSTELDESGISKGGSVINLETFNKLKKN